MLTVLTSPPPTEVADDLSPSPADMQNLVDRIIRLLDDAGIPYCFLRNRALVPDGLLGWTDVDIFLPASTTFDQLVSLFAPLMPAQIGPLRPGQIKFFLPVGTMYLLADIVCGRLDRHGVTYIDDQELLAGRRDDRGIMVAAPIHQAFNVWLTKLLWLREVPCRYHTFIANAVKDDPVTFHRLATRAFGESLANRMMDLALTDRVGESNVLAEPCKRALWREAFRRDPVGTLRDSVNDVRYAVQRLIDPAGFEVALLGPDGVGKSSLATYLSTRPRRETPFKSVMHQQTYRPVLPRLSTMARTLTRRPLPARANPLDPHGAPPLNPVAWLARYGYYTVDQWLALLDLRRQMASGHLVIKDRHWIELGVDPRRYRYAGPRFLPRLLSRMVPQPELVIVLDAPTETIQARKQELTAGDIDALKREYLRLLGKVRHGYLVDADQPLADAAADVLAIVNQHARERTLRRFPHART